MRCTTGASVPCGNVVVPPTTGSQDEPMGVPESCSRTVGNVLRYWIRAVGGSDGFVTLVARKRMGCRLVGEGSSRRPTFVLQA